MLLVRCSLLPGQVSASPGLLRVPPTICPILSTWPSLSLTRSSVRSTHYLSYTVLRAFRGVVVCVPHRCSSGCTVSIGLVGLGAGVAVVVGVYVGAVAWWPPFLEAAWSVSWCGCMGGGGKEVGG